MKQQDTLKCYEVLGVPPGCSAEKVRKAYLDLAHQWDPEQHLDDPVARAEIEKKRHEIDEAYQAIRFFLPELQSLHDKKETPRFTRDFQELAVEPKQEISKGLLGLLSAVVLLVVIGLAFYLFQYGKSVTRASHSPDPIVQE